MLAYRIHRFEHFLNECPLIVFAGYVYYSYTGLRAIYVMFFKFLQISFQMKNNDDMWL